MRLITILFLNVIVFLPCYSLAQDDIFGKPKVFEGGLTFGASITRVDGDTYNGYHKIGIQAGGLVYVHLNNILGVSMELLYSQKGARGGNVKESIYLGTYIDKYYLNLNYAELPLLLHYTKLVFFDFEAGVSYARLVKTKEWAEADVPVLIDPVLNRINSQDIDGIFGVTARLGKNWCGSIRYQYSLMPIRNWDRVPARYSQYSVDEYNNVVIFRVIYIL